MSNYIPGTPSTLSGLGSTGIRRVYWESKLRRDSIRPSVFEQLKGAIKVVDNVISTVKTGIFIEINQPPESSQSVRLSMRTPLRKAPIYGTGNDVLGNEDEQGLIWTELFYNEIKKGVKYKKWGYDFNDTRYLNYVETNSEAITEFMAENRDTRIHQALTVTYADELTYAPVSASPIFNKNWVLPNISDASYPAWDLTAPTVTNGAADSDSYYSSRTYSGATSMVENIAAALLSASGTGSTSKALMTVDFLAQLSYYLPSQLIMEPIELDGVATYIILVADRVANWMMNPNNTGSWGSHMKSVAEYKDPQRMQLLGEFGRAYGNLVFVRNLRAPTLKVSGSAGSYTLQVGYVQPGNNDDRNNSDWSATSGSLNYVFDLCYALGKNALAEYVVDPMRSDLFENTEYGKIEGRAAYMGSGMQLLWFDKDVASRSDTAGSVTQIQRGSAIIPVSRTPIATIT